jgi:hypothetical protein
MAKGLPPLRMTKAVQNVNPIPVARPSKFVKGANSTLKLKAPKLPGSRPPKGTFA